jgi:pimeloyl-ACP methyl ester carboxylesterase
MSAIIVENGLVHYEAIGRGKPVLFLHGWLGSWRYWMPTMEAISDHYRTYALDLWGFGDSDKSQQRYGVQSYVSLIGEFMDGMGLVQLPIVGHALGAIAAVLFAAQAPDRVDKLMAVSLPLTASAISRKISDGGLPRRSASTRAGTGERGNGLLERALGRKQAQQAYPEVAMEADKTDPDAITLSTQSLSNLDLRPELDKITRPLLIVHGERDTLVTPPSADAGPAFLSGAVQGADEFIRQIGLKDSMHFPMLDEAARFQRLLRDFLDGDLASLELKEEWKRRAR